MNDEWEKLKIKNIIKDNNISYLTIGLMFLLLFVYGFFILEAPWYIIIPAGIFAFVVTLYTFDGAQAIRKLISKNNNDE